VKDLASVFRTRIELRQIGVRDEAKMMGGLGVCGRVLCCNSFLGDFQPVSIKMAKEQGLSLNPTKISGACGRLMCCLKYEQEAYEEILKRVPNEKAIVETPDGQGVIVAISLLKELVKVKLDKDNETDLKIYHASEVKVIKDVSRDEIDEEIDLEELKQLED
jgi:cell fate regulator YaaT (PSP1 superfamily)